MNDIMSDILHKIEGIKSVIEASLTWADRYNKESFPRNTFKEYRRLIKTYDYSLKNRCSIAAYGESQVGKSYLMSSLLSSSDEQFVVEFNGRKYSFVDEINPSGGNSTEVESTGVITRFTTDSQRSNSDSLVKIQNLSMADLLMLLVDAYYNDVKIETEKSLSSEAINKELVNLREIWRSKQSTQTILDEDNIVDIKEYVKEVIGAVAGLVSASTFFDTVAENIKYIPVEKWVDVFELLWNKNENFSKIFRTLLEQYKKLSFNTEIYVPYDAILRENGTLMQIQWLDLVCGKSLDGIELPVLTSNVYDVNGKLIASDFPKTYLSAFAAEIELVLPLSMQQNRPFLKEVDLLDFPGARNRLDKIEEDIDYVSDMPEMLRRGKVAYLFNKYVRTSRISSIMFCHHHSQKKANLGNTIKSWVDTLGKTPADRRKKLANLDYISPLFIVATKFNKDLSKRGTETQGKLANHWERFTRVLPEIVGSSQWFERWQEINGNFVPFRSIYPLRDFYWSSCGPERSGLFDGYVAGVSEESGIHAQEGYPDYFEDLHRSFMELPFVQEHFADPEQTWNDVMTINKDGSEPIIRDVSRISGRLHADREQTYNEKLAEIMKGISGVLNGYFEPENEAEKYKKVKMVTSRIRTRLYLSVAEKPEIFGKIIDSLMIEPEEFRKIARSIIVLRTETPRDFSAINFLRANICINPRDDRSVNLNKMFDFFGVSSIDELAEEFAGKDYTIEDVINDEQEFCATVSDVITKHILDRWMEHLNESVQSLSKYLPYSEEVVLAFQTLIKKLGVKREISENISKYEKMFDVNERLNAIADYAALELNNFISTVGRKYMSSEHLQEIKDKATHCGITVDLSSQGIEPVRKRQTLTDALLALDKSTDIMRKPAYNDSDMETLRRLPLWDNFQRWQNLLLVGMILSSGVSTKDPVENNAVKELIDKANSLCA